MTGVAFAAGTTEQVERAVETSREVVERHRRQATRGELERERHAVEPARDRRDRREVAVVEHEIGPDAPCPVEERQTWDRMRRFSNGSVYVNFAGFDDEKDVSAATTMGSQLARLERVRTAYDPDGVFAGAARRP